MWNSSDWFVIYKENQATSEKTLICHIFADDEYDACYKIGGKPLTGSYNRFRHLIDQNLLVGLSRSTCSSKEQTETLPIVNSKGEFEAAYRNIFS